MTADYAVWGQWEQRYTIQEAVDHAARYRIAAPMDAVLDSPRVNPFWTMVEVPFKAPGIVLRIMLWQVWDLDDLHRVICGMVTFAALHEVQEKLFIGEVLARDPHGADGELVPFQFVMTRAGAKFWIENAEDSDAISSDLEEGT